MPILHVRNVPARLYARLQSLAEANHRSLSAEVLARMEESIDRSARVEEQKALIAGIRSRRKARGPIGSDAAAWIREDRDRESGNDHA